ncbi:glycosyl transferase family 39 [Caldicellulosiruptor hydrothermalis 108]|uniref:Glycosyl transferase family 39 n=1 Tax=Caldicellulosiruptor hydrothermalis (strain DSM 18901 / VKM B-2411 / 108) TaxID=632292 RepID=E4Q9Q9_CALH1|nr:glycosyltransferase family 39 protein [Caldicellulosiruptor hydrothermalis]ADQ08164.1 glycosyl transferase family 39 [Caldicellulosiruptor hydrothermalis 108]
MIEKVLILKKRILKWSSENLSVYVSITVGLFLYLFRISKEGYANEYYAAAVKSMMQSFKNFFFVSFDPAGFVTVDKPPLGFWIQTIFCLIFGYSGLSLLLPQIIAAILSILLVYIIVEKYFGKTSAFLSSLFLATTPIYTAIARNNTIDMLMIFSCIVAIFFALKAIEKSSFKYLLISVFIVGLGFNIKMLQAWIVAPGIFLAYLIFADKKILKRFVNLAAALLVFLVSSLWWCIAVDLTPQDKRPYVGSSQTNSALELAFSYNGIQRFLPSSGNITSIINSILGKNSAQTYNNSSFGFGGFSSFQNINPMGAREGGEPGILRLFNINMAGQISWVLIASILALAILTFASIRIGRKSKTIGAFTVIWGTWFLLLAVYFSFTRGLFHIYYLATMAPSASVLAGIGLGIFFDKTSFVGKLAKVAAVIFYILTSAYQLWTIYRYEDSTRWWPAFALLFLLVTIFVAAAFMFKDKKVLRNLAISLVAISLSIMPFYWSLTCSLYQINAVIPSAGNPQVRTSGFGPNFGQAQDFQLPGPRDNFDQGRRFDGLPPSNFNTQADSQTAQDHNNSRDRGFGFSQNSSDELINWLLKNNTGEKYILAVTRATEAAPIIIKTGKAVMAMGGFSGNDPILTVEKLKKMVKNGEVKYFQIGGMGGFRGGFGLSSSSDIYSWILENGELVNSQYNIYMVDKGKIK